MKYLTLSLFITASLPATLPEAHADVLLFDAVESAPANAANGVQRPVRGQTMQFVTRQFGEPDSMLHAVGNPPITRWVYPGFTVYFEHQQVITSVVNR
ncbi:MAG: hypothetical protein H6964_01445 [Chromatiaceae bacterium]|nr:hypothetical protein [Gammaproteobacteria bacterium]MCB1860633.1 hypothetical protein [Gammaproteobacteria bacterium]MCB1879778.1 hypothetical protein [Gammaproteobacteria bacterium]MCB1903166.1 hypothetical protein [Gammaproteobacteria bacterium]MCP5445643.1 hypothetical protein [Chromatiaceae bacterium]